MAILGFEGFDWGASLSECGFSVSGDVTTTSTAGTMRTGLFAMRVEHGAYAQRTLTAGVASLGVGFAFRPGNWVANTTKIVEFLDNTSVSQGYLTINGSNNFALLRGDGTVLGTYTGVAVAANVYHYLEVFYGPHDTTGRAVLYVDGAATPRINFTGDTRNAGAANVGMFRLKGGGVSPAWDDWWTTCTGTPPPGR